MIFAKVFLPLGHIKQSRIDEKLLRTQLIEQKNDLILIAGKGHENYQILGTKKVHFDDKKVAQEFLRDQIH